MDIDLLLLAKALLLGVVEGLTEFLPISSTGHLIILGSLIGYDNEQSKVFKIVIQLGAILAVCWHYRSRLTQTVTGLQHSAKERHFAALLVVGFLPAAVLGVLFHSIIKHYLFNPLTVAGALIGGGLVILWMEKKAFQPRVTGVDNMSLRDALKVGFAQCVAMFPGVSRSGSTIIGGMLFGLSRKTATEFSFFLAIPTMFGATVYDLAKNWQLLHWADFPVFLVGFFASFTAAVLSVRALLRYVSAHDYTAFAWYRIAFGALVLISAATGWVNWS